MDGKPQSAPRTDVAADKEKKGFYRGAEKMGNLAQFQVRTIRYFVAQKNTSGIVTRLGSFRGRNERRSATQHVFGSPPGGWLRGPIRRRTSFFKAVLCHLAERRRIRVCRSLAYLASPWRMLSSFERDLDRDNHIETLRDLPLPDLKHLEPNGELHRRAAELQEMLAVRRLRNRRLRRQSQKRLCAWTQPCWLPITFPRLFSADS